MDSENLRRPSDGKALLPAQLFHHQELFRAIRSAPLVGQKGVLNTLHYIHFMNGDILVHASDPQYKEDFLLRARLDACPPGEIVCSWLKEAPVLPKDAKFPNVIISDGHSLILLPVRLTRLDEKGFAAVLPEKGHLLSKRSVLRNPCDGIGVSLTQSGFLARGELIDFSPLAFRVRLRPDASGSFIWFNKDSQITISLAVEERILFSGPCRCIRQTGGLFDRELVLAALGREIRRFQKKKIRNPRLRVTPPPSAYFEHPFFHRLVQRDICNLTFSGFAVEEQAAEGVLMPGMIIPRLEIRYADMLKMNCDCQVIYRRPAGKGRVICGIAILDMDFRNYRHLSHIMVHAGDPQARFSSELEMDGLWEFFFNSGFIYPKKYQMIQSSREQFKATYSKLYNESQELEAHFTYAENGRIYGHVSIFRAYQRAWMVHHLAARPLDGKRTGFPVLKNILRFFDGLYRYPSIRMDYMIFYFRPENHFPNLFFGGFARELANPQACSLDLFAYMSDPTSERLNPLPPGWQLIDFQDRHFPVLERFYRNTSGGLLLDVLRLGQKDDGDETIEEVYRRHGFLRRVHIHSLVQEGVPKAVLIENHSEPGLNLAELLNGLTVIVTDPAGLPWRILNDAMASLKLGYAIETVPLMIYPASYPVEQGLKVDKQYLLWILNAQNGKEYLEYMEKKTKLTPRFLIKYLLRKLVRK